MKTKNFISTIFFSIFLISSNFIFSQNFYWSKQIKGNKFDGAGNMIITREGKLFISGSTESKFLFFEHDTIVNANFLAKFDEEGNEIWAKGYNAPLVRLVLDTGRSEIITGGFFNTSCYFGDTLLTGAGLTIYILKMDLDGNIIWIRTAGGSGADYLTDITCDPQGNIYIAGCNQLTAKFDDQVIPAGGYIVKYNTDGSVLWAKQQFRKYSNSYPISEVETTTILANDEAIYLNGSTHNDTIILDTVTIMTPNSYECSFLASFSSEGDFKWIKVYGQPESQSGLSMVHYKQGEFYTTGRFFNSCIFGNDTLTSALGGDCYFSKHKPNGEIEWVRQLNVTKGAWGLNLVSDTSNAVYLSGVYTGTAFFGNFILTADSMNEAFLARYDSSGMCYGAFTIPNVLSYSIAIDPQGNLGMTGSFINTATIGPNTFISMGDLDIYLAKCSPITGMRDQNNFIDNKLLIYANPNTGKCNINVPDEFLHEKSITLTVYDNQGKMVQSFSFNLSENKIQLNLSAYATGIYNATLTNGKKSYSGRIVFAGK